MKTMVKQDQVMPKDARTLVKKLAVIQRKVLEIMRAGLPDGKSRAEKLFKNGEQVIQRLFKTQYAFEEMRVIDPEDPFDLGEAGDFLLGLYARERIGAEEKGKACDEDLFYAGAYLKQRAEIDTGEREDPFMTKLLEDMSNEETAAVLQRLNEKLERELAEAGEPKVIPLFGNPDNRRS